MWKHIFGYGNTRFWLRKDTGTMNRPLRLAGCFATHFVGVCGYFTVRIWYIGVVCKAKTSKGTMRNTFFSQHLRG